MTTLTVDPRDFRRTMAEFASGVTVVTAGSAAGPVGFACQSFTSVSLEPALVLFCVDRRSRTWPLIESAGRFCVNVLAGDQAHLCERFGSPTGRKFEGLPWSESPWGTPSIPGALAAVHCSIETVHTAGDHEVVIGRVLGMQRREVEPGDQERPLVFFRGRFGLDGHDESDLVAALGWLDGWA